MLRDQPDYRVTPYISSLYTSTPYSIAWRDTYRFWSVMDENSFNGGLNKSIGDIRLGVGYLKKLRNFKARIFRYESTDLLNEITNNTDRYTADFDLANAYRKGELDNLFSSEEGDTSDGVFLPGKIDTTGIMGLKNET